VPNPRYSKAKGRSFENEVVDYLVVNGYPDAERRRLSGAQDKGDIAGVALTCIEAKHERSYKLPEWLREANTEAINANVPIGVVWARQNGKTGAGNGFVIMSPATFLLLLKAFQQLDRQSRDGVS
jgi:hypothetical protein